MSDVPERRTSKDDRWIALGVVAALAAVVTVYYGPFLHNFFYFDDFLYVENMYKGFLDILLGYNTFRIVSNLSWWPLFQLSGFDPLGYNAFSFGMLFMDALIFYFLAKAFLRNAVVAALAAVLFAGGSVGADALFWKCTNSTLLCFFFYNLTLLCYFRRRQEGKSGIGIASLLAFALAILSKEEAASLPGVLILVEFLLLKERSPVAVIKRIAPYGAIIVCYLVGSREFFALVGHQQDPTKFFQVRPWHTLLTPWSVFTLHPQGSFDFSNPFLYLIPVALASAIFWVPQKRELALCYGWIFLTFVPQSLTSLGQFSPPLLSNSVSRYLFLPSAGAALALALVLAGIGSRWGKKVGVAVSVVVLGLYFSVHYARVQERGSEWGSNAEKVREFVQELRKVVPRFPANSCVFVLNSPTGRAYVQQALRASYGTTDITWIVDPLKYHPKGNEKGFLIDCSWLENSVVVQVEDFESGMARMARYQ